MLTRPAHHTPTVHPTHSLQHRPAHPDMLPMFTPHPPTYRLWHPDTLTPHAHPDTPGCPVHLHCCGHTIAHVLQKTSGSRSGRGAPVHPSLHLLALMRPTTKWGGLLVML